MSAATEARDTAAHAIARARSRGLHGRAALAGAYQSLTAGTAFVLREGGDADARRWEKASSLVFDRLVALDEPAPTARARVKRHRAPSGNRDADYFQPVCEACGWEGASYSNRTVEGRTLAEKHAAEHRCRAVTTSGGAR